MRSFVLLVGYVCVCMLVCLCVCGCVRLCRWLFACLFDCLFICMFVCLFVFVFVCECLYVFVWWCVWVLLLSNMFITVLCFEIFVLLFNNLHKYIFSESFIDLFTLSLSFRLFQLIYKFELVFPHVGVRHKVSFLRFSYMLSKTFSENDPDR